MKEIKSAMVTPGRIESNVRLDSDKTIAPTMEEVIAETFDVPVEVMKVPFSRTRIRRILDPRYVYIYYVSQIKELGPSATGRHVGRLHCDIINACKQYEKHYSTNKQYRERVDLVLKKIHRNQVTIPEICRT
jgi:chromosomal replication initiation ATPase DnaA